MLEREALRSNQCHATGLAHQLAIAGTALLLRARTLGVMRLRAVGAVRTARAVHRLRRWLAECTGSTLHDQGRGKKQLEKDSFHGARRLYRA